MRVHQSVRDTTTIAHRAKAAGTPTINYGVFLQGPFDFIISAFVRFMFVK